MQSARGHPFAVRVVVGTMGMEAGLGWYPSPALLEGARPLGALVTTWKGSVQGWTDPAWKAAATCDRLPFRADRVTALSSPPPAPPARGGLK